MKLGRIQLDRLRDLGRLRGAALHLSGRQRRIARWIGMGLLAIACFLVTLKFTFPYERLKGKLIETLSAKYDVTVGDVGGGFLPGTVIFENVVLRSRPTAPGEKASEILIDEVVVDMGLDFGLLGALRNKVVLNIHADLVGGEIDADIDASASMIEASVETEGLALGKLPGVAAAVGLPMSGSLDADVELRLPGAKWKNAEGHIHVDCLECTVGDGVAKMTMTPSATSSSGRRRRTSAGAAAFGSTGVTVPRLALGEARVEVDISKGVGEIKTFAATSKDGWLKIEGKIEFRDPFANTLFPGCMRFKLSDELKQRDPNFGNIEYTLSEKVRQGDGSFAIPTKGKLTELRWDVRRKCGGGSTEENGEGRTTPERPGLAGRPSLDGQPPGGEDTAQRPEPSVRDPAAAAGQNGDQGADGSGQPPVPGTSGPPLGTATSQPADGTAAPAPPGQPPPGVDEGAASGAPPPPPPEPGELRRVRPDEQPPPPPPEAGEPQPAPPPDQGVEPPPPGQEQPPPGQEQPQPQPQEPPPPGQEQQPPPDQQSQSPTQ